MVVTEIPSLPRETAEFSEFARCARAHVRKPVGQQDDAVNAFLFQKLATSCAPLLTPPKRAVWPSRVYPADGIVCGMLVGHFRGRHENMHGRIVGDNRHDVVRGKAVNRAPRRFLSTGDFLALHRTRFVEDDGQVYRRMFLGFFAFETRHGDADVGYRIAVCQDVGRTMATSSET